MAATRTPPTGITRWFFRAPITLYRLHLGALMGSRFVLINHVGRKTGLPRQVVVEVVRLDAASGSVIVSSGWGESSQWFQNLQAHPDVSIVLGNRTLDVHAHRLSAAEGEEEMLDYARRHPAAARKLCGYMGFADDGTEATYREVGRTLPFIRFEPR